MPIRPDLRHFYRTPEYLEARKRVRERAGDRCERCHKPNGVSVQTVVGKVLAAGKLVPYMFWRIPSVDIWHSHWGAIKSKPEPAEHHSFKQVGSRIIRAKCGAAHLNHQPGDDRDENLAWLCDWCHFHLDRDHHHQTRGARRDSARPILTAAHGEVV